MLFMVIERFRENDMVPIYQRLRESGILFLTGWHTSIAGSSRTLAVAFS
jgi:hypothetical protein